MLFLLAVGIASCRSALVPPAVGLALLRFPSTIRLVDLVLKLRVFVFAASCSTRSLPHAPHALFLIKHFHVLRVEIVPHLGSFGSHVHVAILLWLGLAGA